VEESQNEDVHVGQLITQQVSAHSEFPHLARIELAEPWPASRKFQQCFGGARKGVKDYIGSINVVLRKEGM